MLAQFDVVFDFTTPQAVIPNMRACLANGARVVVGTTGWYEKLPEIRAICERRNGALLYGANFSIGVQVGYGWPIAWCPWCMDLSSPLAKLTIRARLRPQEPR